ncbi:aldose 1-epimerase [uncultured Vibrio sp.]|uniref:aldose 1-epimerase n=1 Tax=uncultured Vibrio sp. TaxID=114054 RepID=UPI0025F7D3DC|nr:aldose 1-epimerase [uncultured Vibrio sp.]
MLTTEKPFEIKKEKFGSYDSVTLLNYNHGIELQVIIGFGAIINRYIVNHSPFSFISGYSSPKELNDQNPFFSRSAKLFPFPNRLANGEYQFDGQHYQLPPNFPWSEHAVHGLLYNQPFELIDSRADSEQASITVRYKTTELHPQFPHAFSLDITYQINRQGQLSCSTSIENNGTHSFPFGDAWHPYFSLNQPLERCLLTMPACLEVEHIDDLPSGHKHAFDRFSQPTSLANVTLNHCFEFQQQAPITLSLSLDDNSASLQYQQDASYPFIQLYTPDSEASIAIEPMTCPANAFNNYIGLLTLEPNQRREFQWQCQAQFTA